MIIKQLLPFVQYQAHLSLKLFLGLFTFFMAEPAYAQEGIEKTGAWYMYFGMNRISDHWSIHSEVQWRNHTVEPNLEQLLLRAGINYHLDKNYMVSAGYAYISSHPYDKDPVSTLTTENRLWQQFIIKNNLSRLYFEHRYRYEQRWIHGDFRQRLRYRIMIAIPLNTKTIEKGSFLLAFYDEIFVNLEKGNVFDRNRLYGALGYQFSATSGIQLGLMEQSLPDFGKLYFQLAFFVNPDFR